MPKISVLIVTKNRHKLLSECLSALTRQRIKPWEILIVDNGSTDPTKTVVKQFQQSLPIRYYVTHKKGYPSIYNYGLKYTRGDWIVFVDDDCAVEKNWMTSFIRAITRSPGAVIQGKTISIPKGNIYAEIMGDHYENWIRANMIGPNRLRTFDNKNLCMPKSVIRRLGVFNEALERGSEDIELGIRYARGDVPILYDPSIVAYHNERGTLWGFIRQHVRIAQSEAFLDTHLSKRDRIGVANKKKTRLHVRSFLRRELYYLKTGRMIQFFQTPTLYVMLAVIRFWSYYMTAWNTQK